MVNLNYTMTEMEDLLTISRIVTIHYYEYKRNFSFDGEVHDFWEFICVDRGDVDVRAGDRKLRLCKDEIAFHAPMEFHDVHTSPHSAPNLVVIAFDCKSPAMEYFREKVLKINEEERGLLANLLREARNCFASRLDDPYMDHLDKRENREAGSEQMVIIYLTSFLIHLMRRTAKKKEDGAGKRDASKSTAINSAEFQYEQIVRYLAGRLGETVTIEQICRDNLVSRSQLLSLFRRKTGGGVIQAFNRMKIEEAKTLIRGSGKQFSEIAEELGYSSIAYFSRQFRKVTDMSPTEYAESIEALSEKEE